MKKILLSLLASGALAFGVQAQTFDFAYAIGGTSNDFSENAVTDATGNLYMVGAFEGTTAFNEAGTTSLSTIGGTDAFVAKYAPSGALVWVKQIGGTDDDYAVNLAIDPSGNLYVGGAFRGTVDFDPGTGTQNLTSLGLRDAFLLKLDSNGDFVYVKQFGGTDSDNISSLAVDANANVYLSIYFRNSMDSDPGAGTQTLTNVGGGGALIKLDASGNFSWSHPLATGDGAPKLTANANGDVYFGYIHFDGSIVDLDRSASTQTPADASAYGQGYWVTKWNSAGTFQWTKTIAAKGFSNPVLHVLGNGNLVLASYFRDSIDLDPNAATVLATNTFSPIQNTGFIMQLSEAGNFVWGQTLAAQNANSSSGFSFMSHDFDNNIYLAGDYIDAVDFDGSANNALDTTTARQPFVLKLDDAGNYLWHYANSSSVVSYVGALAVSLNAEHLYLSGWQNAAFVFASDSIANLGGYDTYIAKWSQTPINISVERTEFAAMQFFPNPSFDGRVNIQLGETSENLQATVFNALGQTISTQSLQNVEQLQVELPAAAGMYFIELRSQDGKSATLKAQRQ